MLSEEIVGMVKPQCCVRCCGPERVGVRGGPETGTLGCLSENFEDSEKMSSGVFHHDGTCSSARGKYREQIVLMPYISYNTTIGYTMNI